MKYFIYSLLILFCLQLLLFSSAKTTPNSVNKIQSIPILIKVHLLNDSSGPLLQIPLKVGYISGVVYVNGQSVTNGIVTRLHMQVTASKPKSSIAFPKRVHSNLTSMIDSEKAGHKYQSNVQIQVRIFVRQLPTSNQNKCRTAVEEEVVEVDSYSVQQPIVEQVLLYDDCAGHQIQSTVVRLILEYSKIYSMRKEYDKHIYVRPKMKEIKSFSKSHSV
ncbi:hypothetical protein TrispH2_012039 [Trichoplax sp. H2]|nr:hypothetical protein TrispH2_012039 [Trichoplax sp. H2]|eukprot:RDD35809.1 hypothetical protein TrispH2_012039 [Trichoplax sp. H2]